MKIIRNKSQTAGFFSSVLFVLLFCFQSAAASDKLSVIVLDAGHGGKDPGTIGLSGIKEKDIVLPITLRLGELISAGFPEVKIIYTRTKDDYPEVKERTQIANSNKANLFISIHANYKKLEETEKKGFEIYLLNKDRFSEALQITMKENLLLDYSQYGKDSLDTFIFSTLSQTGYQKQSEILASQLQYKFLSSTELESRGVMQAGYWVNVASSMPSVLVECGYLSDAGDEKYLMSSQGQESIAKALFEAFTSFKYYYEIY